jgi:hypothetical protein
MLLEGGLDWKPMSLSPKDMDFIEAKHVAAREIALALGVPPMLLGIPGDNTYSNYQEATRTFWRSTVLPLVTRTAKALSTWLSPAWGTPLDLRPDLDAIEALNSEREALWTRIDKATFLTPNEKRAAVGYGPLDDGPNDLSRKYRSDQARDEIGRWTDEAGGSDGASESNLDDPNVIPVARRSGGLPRAVWKETVRQFVSRACRASINRELPGQFEDVEIGELLELARGGDRAARTCVKLLERQKYRK